MKHKAIQEWIAKAEEDYLTLEIPARQRKKRVHDSVCFHAQQCAEKYLKALLVLHRISTPKIHDLGQLADLLNPREPAIALMTDLCDQLTRYGIEFRYPGEDATSDRAKTACSAAKEIRHFVRARLNLR